MTRSFTPPRGRRGRDTTTFAQGLTGMAFVTAIAALASLAGWGIAVLVSWVY